MIFEFSEYIKFVEYVNKDIYLPKIKNYGMVFVVEFNTGTIKIGKTINILQQINTLSKSTIIKNIYFTNPHLGYSKTKDETIKHFSSKLVTGEVFEAQFKDVIDYIENKNITTLSKDEVDEIKRLEKVDMKKNVVKFFEHWYK